MLKTGISLYYLRPVCFGSYKLSTGVSDTNSNLEMKHAVVFYGRACCVSTAIYCPTHSRSIFL